MRDLRFRWVRRLLLENDIMVLGTLGALLMRAIRRNLAVAHELCMGCGVKLVADEARKNAAGYIPQHLLNHSKEHAPLAQVGHKHRDHVPHGFQDAVAIPVSDPDIFDGFAPIDSVKAPAFPKKKADFYILEDWELDENRNTKKMPDWYESVNQ